MTPKEIKVGTRLEFEMLNKNGEKQGNTFISQLLEHQSDGSMIIYAPISEARVVYVPTGITVRLTFVHYLHGLLGFKALVRAKEYKGNIAILIIEPDETIEKIQRREHYRLDVVADVLIWPVEAQSYKPVTDVASAAKISAEADAEAKDIDTDKEGITPSAASTEVPPVKAFIKNLSGSGACVLSETNFPRNSEVRIEIDLNNNIKFSAKCIVLRTQSVEIRKGRSFELGMHFTEIKPKDQDNLIKYIFEQQRLLLKKEK